MVKKMGALVINSIKATFPEFWGSDSTVAI